MLDKSKCSEICTNKITGVHCRMSYRIPNPVVFLALFSRCVSGAACKGVDRVPALSTLFQLEQLHFICFIY